LIDLEACKVPSNKWYALKKKSTNNQHNNDFAFLRRKENPEIGTTPLSSIVTLRSIKTLQTNKTKQNISIQISKRCTFPEHPFVLFSATAAVAAIVGSE
jgi:hypothetical protein